MQNRIPTPPDQRPPIPEFTPVPRKYRHDGWTPERQRAFIDALAETGSVGRAARRLNMSAEGAYYLRRQPGAESFRAAWTAAIDFGVQNLTDIAMERAIDGVPVPVFWKGEQVGEKRSYNDRLLMFMLRHRQPGTYGPLARVNGGTTSPEFRALQERDAREQQEREDEAIKEDIVNRILTIRRGFLRRISPDPAKRAAWELLVGPVDWPLAAGLDQPDANDTNMTGPDRVVIFAEPCDDAEDESDSQSGEHP